MKRHLLRLLTYGIPAILVSALPTSCSVKEDRIPCPCYLIFKPGEGIDLNAAGRFTVTVNNGAGKEMSTDIGWHQLKTGDYSAGVSKGEKDINILWGRKDSYLSGSGLFIIKGHQADSIYSSICHVSCFGEEAVVPMENLKQFSTVFLTLMDSGERLPWKIRIKSFVEGIDLADLSPILGEFHLEPEPANENGSQFRFRLPRQIPELASELVMELWKPAENRQEEDILVDTLPLGTMILEAHHDWNKPSLEDIHIGLGYTRTGIKVDINDWIIEWERTVEI